MWRVSAVLLLAAAAPAANSWTLEKLFTRPYVWGTAPEQLTWSKQGETLAFLWNAEGHRFRDLYAYEAASKKLTRLTNLAGLRDPINTTPAEKDERLKRYLVPPDGLAAFELARDGTRAAFSYRGDLYLVRTAKPANPDEPFRLTRTRAAETSPQFSPEAGKLAFQREGQLYVQDLATAQLTQVTEIEDNALSAFRWSPDGKRFVYGVRGSGARRLPLPNYSGRAVNAPLFARTLPGDPPNESRWFVIGAEGGEAKPLEPAAWGTRVYGFETPEWSPDSGFLMQRVIHPAMKRLRLRVWKATGGKPENSYEDNDKAWVEPAVFSWSPDSKNILYTSERDGWAHLYRMPREGGKPRQLTQGKFEIHTERLFPQRDPQWVGDYIYYSSTEPSPAERQFYRVRSDGTAKERLSKGEGIHLGVVSADGKHTAMLSANLQHPFELSVDGRRIAGGARKEFAAYPWPQVRFVKYPSRGDHKPVAAKMMLPPGYDPFDPRQKPRPAILFIHGSGYATSVLKQWGSYVDIRYAFNAYLANQGYVVFEMDYRGSSGYGRDWRTGVYLHMGGKDLDDVLGGIDYLKSLGSIDMQRVGIWGSSYGGFMTNMAMFLSPDTFRAGAAFSAVNDWENYNAYYTEQRLTRPEQNPEAYRRSSPMTFSSGLKNPLLMVHGIVDNNVMFQEAVQLSEKLTNEGKSFEQAFYAEESHAFVRDESIVHAFKRAAEFFDRYLK